MASSSSHMDPSLSPFTLHLLCCVSEGEQLVLPYTCTCVVYIFCVFVIYFRYILSNAKRFTWILIFFQFLTHTDFLSSF